MKSHNNNKTLNTNQRSSSFSTKTTTLRLLFLQFVLLIGGCSFPCIFGAQLVEITNFGFNPNGLQMFEYVPANVVARPALLVVNHWCTGSALAMFYWGASWSALADQRGFIVLYTQSTHDGNCFDVYSAQGLKRDGGSDSQSIVAMVKFEIQRRNIDPAKVYVTGLSSGAMMTEVLLAEYPDVFAAGTAVSGGPFGCFATTPPATKNSTCATGQLILTPQQWGDKVRAAAYWGYNGARVQLVHGTNDSIISYKLLAEEIKQWTNVYGLSQQPNTTDQLNIDGVSAIRTRFGNVVGNRQKVEAISMIGSDHMILVRGTLRDMVARFLGLIA